MATLTVPLPTCGFNECAKPARALGLCKGHWKQQHAGKTLRPLRSADPIERFWLRVEKTDGCWLWIGPDANGAGYGKVRIDTVGILVHRFSFELANGPIPDGLEIDHICRIRNCVRPDHLRLATRAQNSQNLGLKSDNTSGHRGVSFSKQTGKFRAYATVRGRTYFPGSFDSVEDAANAASELRRSLFTHSSESVSA